MIKKRVANPLPKRGQWHTYIVVFAFLLIVIAMILWSYKIALGLGEPRRNHPNHQRHVVADRKYSYLQSHFSKDVEDRIRNLEKKIPHNASSDLVKLLNNIDAEYQDVKSIFASIEKKRNEKGNRRPIDKLYLAMMAEERKQLKTLGKDSKLNSLEYFPVLPPSHNCSICSALTNHQLEDLAKAAIITKGVYIQENFTYSHAQVQSFGRYYQYQHHYEDPCLIRYLSMKSVPSCGIVNSSRAKEIGILVVGVQRSGTHYTWEMLNRLGVKVHHEGVGPDGAVGWPFAVNAMGYMPGTKVGYFARGGYVLNNPEKLRHQSFKHVFHQVRHPLRVIKTIVQRCSKWDKFWRWISGVKGCEAISQTVSPLRRAMMLYVLWNKHIERYADIRFQTEITSPRDICRWARFNESLCDALPVDAEHQIEEPPTSIVLGTIADSQARPSSSSKLAVKSRRLLSLAIVPTTHIDSLNAANGTRSSYRLKRVDNSNETNNTNASHFDQSQMTTDKRDTKKDLSVLKSLLLLEDAGVELTSWKDKEKYLNKYSKRMLPPSRSSRRKAEPPAPQPIPNITISWEILAAEDSYLTNELRVMCLEYGYNLDPDVTPQLISTKQFTA